MLKLLLLMFTVGAAFARPAVALACLLQIYVLRVAVFPQIISSCESFRICKVESDPIFGAALPVVVFSIISIMRIVKNNGKFNYTITLFDKYFAATCFMMIAGCLWTPDLSKALDITGRYLLLGMPYFFVTKLYFQNAPDKSAAIRDFFLTSYIISLFVALLAVYYYVTLGPFIRMSLPGAHPIPFSLSVAQGFLLACGVFFTGGQAVGVTSKWFRIMNIGVIFFLLFCQFLTNTRGVTIFMGLSALILFYLNIQKIGFLKIGLVAPFLFVAFGMILSKFDPRVLFMRFIYGFRHDQSTSERIDAWSEAMDMLANSPIIGVGTDGYRFYGSLLYPHNYFLELIASFGLFGVVLSIFMIGLFFYYAKFLNPKNGGTVQYQLVYVMALFNFLESAVSFTLWMHKGLYFWLGLLMIIATFKEKTIIK